VGKLLNVQSLSKRYGKATVLDSVTFQLEPGAVLAVVGGNGAGKSTLIKSIVGLIRYDGQIDVDGIDVRRHGREARRRMGYLAQTPAFHTDLAVRETVIFYARLRHVSEEAARAAVEAVGLTEHAEKSVGALSGGMRQRLALAVAQLGDPALLVLDEPTSGLDISARLELRRFIQEQRGIGRTVIFSTHWMEDIASVADTVLVLDQGRMSFIGSADTFSRQMSPRSRMFMRLNGHGTEALPLLETIAPGGIAQTGEWVIVTCLSGDKGRVFEALVGAGISILDVRVEDAAGAPTTSGITPNVSMASIVSVAGNGTVNGTTHHD